jgi:hypothetical protein
MHATQVLPLTARLAQKVSRAALFRAETRYLLKLRALQ